MNLAEIKIWDELVGAVSWDDAAGLATFEYSPGFKLRKWDLAPLQMPVDSPVSIFAFPTLRRKGDSAMDTFKGLPGLLADVLPDRYGNELVNQWLAHQGRPQNSMNPVEMLCFIGTRGMGALEFEPATFGNVKQSVAVEMDSLVRIAKKMLSKKKNFITNLKRDDESAVKAILGIGTSAGGVRPKAVIAYNEKTGEIRSGQTNAPKGFEHWLIKLDGVSDVQLGNSKGYGRVEMAYHKMAHDCGIEMLPSRLMEENGRAHFMTKRFDREGGSIKHHVQTFCALKHFDFNEIHSFSYEQLFQTMRELNLPYPAAEQLFRRMVFNVLARNCDDHTKNFSFRLKKDEAWELAPAYDVCHAYQPQHQWVSQHALSINGKRTQISRKDLLSVGNTIKTRQVNPGEIISEIQQIVKRWNRYADKYKVPPKLRDEIGGTLVRLK